MNRHGSLNAVLAGRSAGTEVDPPSPDSQTSSPSLSPTSGAPSFSWPRRVRSPEPYVPLRKASPERLHNRKQSLERLHNRKPSPDSQRSRKAAPHPLFVTTNSGSRGYAPGTSSRTAATPHFTQIYAAPERDQDRRTPVRHAGRQQNVGQPLSARTTPDQHGPRKVSWPLPVDEDIYRNHDHAHHHHSHNHDININSNKNNRHHTQPHPHPHPHPPRKSPSPNSQRKHPTLKPSQSYQDGLRSIARDRLYSIGQESNGRHSPALHNMSDLHEGPEEVRASFRSALTSSSSRMGSTTETARSSVGTADSSFSDFVKIDRVETPELEEEPYSDDEVDDMLDLYAAGFETPLKQSLEVRRDSFPRASLDSNRSNLRPHPSPLGSNALRNNPHRRSRSASFIDLDRLRNAEIANQPLPKPGIVSMPPASRPPLGHTRSSTQIIAGREMPSVPPSVSGSSVKTIKIPRDRYGFKKVTHYITEDKFDAWEKTYGEHLDRRRGKWLVLMKQYGLSTDKPTRFPPKSDKVKRYVRKGVPPDWRGAAWFWYAGGPGKLARDPGLYRKLLQDVNKGKLSDNDREHIERDLNRTFPDNIRFKADPTTARDSHTEANKVSSDDEEPETAMVQALRRVLQAFAVHNPNIGYCQSLNFIAGLLLIFLDADEEKTFILLNVVTTEHLPGTHGVALEGANIDIAVLMSAIRENIPPVWTQLDDRQPDAGGPARLPTVSLATTAWFMSLFVGTLPIECVLRVWDCLFFEGSKTLFRAALAIFKIGEQQIRSVNDPMEVFQVVQSMPRAMLDANTLMECCFRKRHGFANISQDLVEKRREERRKDVREGRTLTDETRVGSPFMAGRRKLARARSRGRFKSKPK